MKVRKFRGYRCLLKSIVTLISFTLFIFSATAAYIEQLCHYMDKEELHKQKERDIEMESIKETLLEQMKVPKNNAIKMDGPLDLNHCGTASAQCFYGEDTDFEQRKKSEQKQVG